MQNLSSSCALIASLALSSACTEKNEAPAAPSSPAPTKTAPPLPPPPPPPPPTTDAWLGKWVGVEGLVLVIDRAPGAPGSYQLTITLLDGTTSYAGTADVDRIRFERNGTEYIRAGKGSDTGLKWLADKNNCLIVKDGEGFCR